MDRNILTAKDVVAIRQRHLDERREKLRAKGIPPEEAADMGDDDAPPKPDDATTRLAKFIPAEALSLYLALAGIAATSATEVIASRYWLVGLLLVTSLFNVLYLRRIWGIERWTQVAVSCIALIVYALATGGPLVQSLQWPPVLTPIAVVVVTAFLAFFQPPERRAEAS